MWIVYIVMLMLYRGRYWEINGVVVYDELKDNFMGYFFKGCSGSKA